MSLHDLVKSFGSADEIREKIVTGAKVDEADKLKRTALHMAAWAGNLEALQILIRAGASLDVKAMDGFTALHFAAQSSAEATPACIRFLVRKNKSLLNMRITKGNKSALHLAAAKGNMLAITALLELGADITAKTTSGQVPSDLAKNPEVKKLLSSYSTSAANTRIGDLNEEDCGSDGDSDVDVVVATEKSVIAPAEMAIVGINTEQIDIPSVSSKKRPISEVTID